MDISNLTDEELVAIIREDNQELYGEIIRRYQSKLSHYLRKFIRSSDELEDVLQDVFIKAYRNLFDFDTSRKFSPWIYRIAHNEAINKIKKYAKEFSLDEEELEIVDEKIDLGGHLDTKLSRETISRGLFRIRKKYREPLILYFFEQKTYEEISDILKIPCNTVGTFIARGKQALKEELKYNPI